MSDAPGQRGTSRSLWIMGVAAALLIVFVLSLPNRSAPSKPGEFRIVCTFLPVYVFTLNLVAGAPGVSVELLLDPSTGCPHDYAVRPADLQRVADADFIVANGLGIDGFVDRLAKDSKAMVIKVSEGLNGLLAGPAHDHSAHEHEGDDHNHEDEAQAVNPHVWVSPTLAIRQVHTLATRLTAADPTRVTQYTRNEAEYVGRLTRLGGDMQNAAKSFKARRIVTFHDAFAYLARDLGLEVVATLTVDPEQMPSAQQLLAVINQIKQTRPAAIFYEPAYSERLARTVSSETGVPMYALNPFNTMEGQPASGSYEDVMRRNLQVLKQALGGQP